MPSETPAKEVHKCEAFCHNNAGEWLKLTYHTPEKSEADYFNLLMQTAQENGDISRTDLENLIEDFPLLTLVSEENAQIALQEQILRDGRLTALREREEFAHGLAHEAAADIFPLAMTAYSIFHAAITFSTDPIEKNFAHIKQAAATIPVFIPLGIEWRIAKRDFRRCNHLLHSHRHGFLSTKVFNAATRQLDAVKSVIGPHLTEEDRHTARALMAPPNKGKMKKEADKAIRRKSGRKICFASGLKNLGGFAKETTWEWASIFTPSAGFKNFRAIFTDVAKATAQTAALPGLSFMELEKERNQDLQNILIESLPEDIYDAIIQNEETGALTIDENNLDQQIEDFEKRYRKRQLRSLGTASAMTGTTVFIEGGCSHMYEVATEDIPEADAVSALLAGALLLGTFISTTLTLTPLKASARKHSKHLERMAAHRQMIGTLRSLKQTAQTNATEPSP